MSFQNSNTVTTATTPVAVDGLMETNAQVQIQQPHQELDTVSGVYWVWGLPQGEITKEFLIGPGFDISDFEVPAGDPSPEAVAALGTTYNDCYFVGATISVRVIDNMPALQGTKIWAVFPSHP